MDSEGGCAKKSKLRRQNKLCGPWINGHNGGRNPQNDKVLPQSVCDYALAYYRRIRRGHVVANANIHVVLLGLQGSQSTRCNCFQGLEKTRKNDVSLVFYVCQLFGTNPVRMLKRFYTRIAAHFHLNKPEDVPGDYLGLCKWFHSYCHIAPNYWSLGITNSQSIYNNRSGNVGVGTDVPTSYRF